jgi:hypothetical protein
VDKFKFAKLISYISGIAQDSLSDEQISRIDIMVTLDPEVQVRTNADQLGRLLGHMKRGSKIEAIKEYRALTGMGLKESKDAVEAFWTFPATQHPEPSPVRWAE